LVLERKKKKKTKNKVVTQISSPPNLGILASLDYGISENK